MLAFILLVIASLFVVALGLKKILSLKLCALCVSVFLTWATLLILYKTKHFHDVALLSLLMGQSITGLYYLVSQRVVATLRIFALPFFLTLTVMFYIAITGSSAVLLPLLVLLGLWVVAYILFISRNDPGSKAAATAVINCCGDK